MRAIQLDPKDDNLQVMESFLTTEVDFSQSFRGPNNPMSSSEVFVVSITTVLGSNLTSTDTSIDIYRQNIGLFDIKYRAINVAPETYKTLV